MHRLVGVEIDLFILDGLPDPLDENIVAPSATTVPADGDAIFFEPPGEGLAGELAALIRVALAARTDRATYGYPRRDNSDGARRCTASATDRRLAPDDRDSRRCCG